MTFLPQHLSVSAVSLYARCPAQWKRRYVDRITEPSTAAQGTGIAFHKALEALHKGQDGELAWLAAADNMEAALAQNSQSLTMSKEHGLKLLGLYRQLGLDTAIGEPERMFKLTVQASELPVPLLGFIDLVLPNEIREFKTTGSGWWNETRAAMADQTHVYGWAVQKLYARRMPMRYVIFRTDVVSVDEHLVHPSPDGFRLFLLQAEGAWKGISEGRYDGCGLKTCGACAPEKSITEPIGPSIVWNEAAP